LKSDGDERESQRQLEAREWTEWGNGQACGGVVRRSEGKGR